MGLFDIFKREKQIEKINTRATTQEAGYIMLSDFLAPYRSSSNKDPMRVPEIFKCIDSIATAASNVTLGLWLNGDKGDTRIHDGISRVIDIEPNANQTRQEIIYDTVVDLILHGNAIWLPKYRYVKEEDKYFLDSLHHVKWADEIVKKEKNNIVYIIEKRKYLADEVIHFKFGDGNGTKKKLKEINKGLVTAIQSLNDFVGTSKFPAAILSLDSNAPSTLSGVTPTFSTISATTSSGFSTAVGSFEEEEQGNNLQAEEQETLQDKITNNYEDSLQTGKPWIVPGRLMKVEQFKPLTVRDTGIIEAIVNYRQSIAILFGVPGYFLKLDKYSVDEYDMFISNIVEPILNEITSRLTKRILLDPKRYFKAHAKSLLNFNFDRRAITVQNLVNGGLMTKNEGRENLGLQRIEQDGADELMQLENYKPIGHAPKLSKEGYS